MHISSLCSAFIVLLSVARIVSAVTFYVDSATGSDEYRGNDPNMPWKSLSPVNSRTFSPGDRILFKAGSRYAGELGPHGSGSDAKPIVIDMYGQGTKPRIDGGGV